MFGAESDSASLSLRARPWKDSRLARALSLSLVIHLLAYGAYEAGQSPRIAIHMPEWARKAADALVPPMLSRTEPPAPREVPLMFVEVNPASAVTTPPEDARHYAVVSTVAAQPEPAPEDHPLPKLEGRQDRILRTEDTPLSLGRPLTPGPLQPAPNLGAEAEPPPASGRGAGAQPPPPAETPGALMLAKPAEIESQADGRPEHRRPRTLAAARARQAPEPRLTTAGEKARAEGGARRRGIVTTLDAAGSPLGVYDAAVVAAIQQRWFDLLDQRKFASDAAGKVVLEFRLHHDGRVTDMTVARSTVDDLLTLLCQKAVLDPAPYARWPAEMRRLIDGDFRSVRFTFFYN